MMVKALLNRSKAEDTSTLFKAQQVDRFPDTLHSDKLTRLSKGGNNFGLRLMDPLLIELFRFGNNTWNVKITLLSTESSLRILLAVAASKEQMA